METRYQRKGLEIKILLSYTLLELDNPYYVCISRSLLFCTCAIFNGSHYQVTWETNFLLCVLLCSVTNNKVSCTNICIAVQRWYVPDYEMHDTVTTLHITYLHIHVYCSMWQRYYQLYQFIQFLLAPRTHFVQQYEFCSTRILTVWLEAMIL